MINNVGGRSAEYQSKVIDTITVRNAFLSTASELQAFQGRCSGSKGPDLLSQPAWGCVCQHVCCRLIVTVPPQRQIAYRATWCILTPATASVEGDLLRHSRGLDCIERWSPLWL